MVVKLQGVAMFFLQSNGTWGRRNFLHKAAWLTHNKATAPLHSSLCGQTAAKSCNSLLREVVHLEGSRKVESGSEKCHWRLSSAFESPANVQFAFSMVWRDFLWRDQEYDSPEQPARLCPELTDKFCDNWWELMLAALHFKNWPSPNSTGRREV